jgi:hypothetical protein
VTLDQHDVEAIATRVTELLAQGLPPRGYVDTATVAQWLEVSEEWVRANAAELGGVRIGGGRRGVLRYDVRQVRAEMDRRAIERAESTQPRRRPGPARGSGGVDLIPIPTNLSL